MHLYEDFQTKKLNLYEKIHLPKQSSSEKRIQHCILCLQHKQMQLVNVKKFKKSFHYSRGPHAMRFLFLTHFFNI